MDNVTSTICRYQQQFGLDVQFSALVHNFNNIFSDEHLFQAGRTMNFLPSQILDVVRHTMKPLEAVILSFDNWSLPWTFFDFVINNHSLAAKDKELFKSIWLTAVDSNNWKNLDLEKGSKLTESRLKQLYILADEAVSNIVRAASYQWK